MLKNFREEVRKTYKSVDTEERIDMYFTRPIGYLWTLFFAKLGVHPNVVTLLSIMLGIFAAYCYSHLELGWNILAICSLMLANFYDSADGQLARMTGKQTISGRILDGFSSGAIFVSIYIAIVVRLWDQPFPFLDRTWGIGIFFLCSFSGSMCHGRQCQLADYYRNVHLFFLQGKKGSEFTVSANQWKEVLKIHDLPWKGNFWYRQFMWAYHDYTKDQERQCPKFQELMRYVQEHQKGEFTEEQRQYFLEHSRPLMKYTNFLTFNWRFIILSITSLLNIQWAYVLFELIVLESAYRIMRYRHNKICVALMKKMQ